MTCTIQSPIKATFLHNPKAAGISISRWLERNVAGKIIQPKHAIYKDLKNQIDLGYTFCVVRNPWDVIVSRYEFILARTKKVIEYLKDPPYDTPVEIEMGLLSGYLNDDNFNIETQTKILQKLEKGFKEFCIDHDIINQTDFSNGCDYVMRYENLVEDFKIIQQKLKCNKDLMCLNKTANKKNYKDYYKDFECIEIIAEKYQTDIETLGYSY